MNKLVSALVIAVLFMISLTVPALGAAKVNADEETYRQLVVSITDITLESVGNMQDAFQQMGANPSLVFETEFVSDVCGEFAVWDAMYKLIDGITPPKQYKAIHKELTEAFRYLSLAGGEYRIGILTIDADSIRAGTDYLSTGTEHLQEATTLMEDLNGS